MATTTYSLSVNGVALNQSAFNFPTREGRLGTPSMRGVDTEIVGGADKPRGHWYGPRIEAWQMWVSGYVFDPLTDTTSSTNTGLVGFETNLAFFKKLLLGNPTTPLVLTKVDPFYGTLTAEAHCTDITVGGILPGSTFAKTVVVDIVIPSGLWRMPSVTAFVSGSYAVGGNATIEPDTITLAAATVGNATTGTGYTYAGGSAVLTLPGCSTVPADAIGGLVPIGVRPFLLAPGANSISGSASMTYRPGVL